MVWNFPSISAFKAYDPVGSVMLLRFEIITGEVAKAFSGRIMSKTKSRPNIRIFTHNFNLNYLMDLIGKYLKLAEKNAFKSLLLMAAMRPF